MSSTLKNRRKRNIRRIVIFAFIFLALGGWLLYSYLSKDDRITIRTVQLERGDIFSYFYTTAEIKPGSITEHNTTVSQKVLAVRVSPHQQVKAGDILAVLDQQELADQYVSAQEARQRIEASLAEADAEEKARLNAAEQDRKDLERNISTLFSSLSTSISQLTRLATLAPASVEIAPDLEEKMVDIITASNPETLDQDIEQLLATLRQSAELVENPEYAAGLSQLEHELKKASDAADHVLSGLASGSLAGSITLPDSITGQIGSLSGLNAYVQDPLAQAIAQEDAARNQYEKSQPYIYAKTDGLVAQINISPGDYTGGSATSQETGLEALLGNASLNTFVPQTVSAITIYDNTRPQAVFYAGRFDAGRIKTGMPVQFDYEGQLFSGDVINKGRIAASQSAGQLEALDIIGDMGSSFSSEPQLEIRMSIKGTGLTELITGFWIDAEIEIDHAEDVVLLPAEAMRRELDTYFIFVIGENNLAAKRTITPGIQSDRYIEVKEGLNEGDRIIINPPSSLQDGMPVKEASDG
jgi:multidrug efflux pump subunit AcrA (membrane-fusion protein)